MVRETTIEINFFEESLLIPYLLLMRDIFQGTVVNLTLIQNWRFSS